MWLWPPILKFRPRQQGFLNSDFSKPLSWFVYSAILHGPCAFAKAPGRDFCELAEALSALVPSCPKLHPSRTHQCCIQIRSAVKEGFPFDMWAKLLWSMQGILFMVKTEIRRKTGKFSFLLWWLSSANLSYLQIYSLWVYYSSTALFSFNYVDFRLQNQATSIGRKGNALLGLGQIRKRRRIIQLSVLPVLLNIHITYLRSLRMWLLGLSQYSVRALQFSFINFSNRLIFTHSPDVNTEVRELWSKEKLWPLMEFSAKDYFICWTSKWCFWRRLYYS